MAIQTDETMVVLPEEEVYETNIHGKGLDTDAEGGIDGEANTGLRGLVNRTAWLKKILSELVAWKENIDFSLYALKNGSIANIFKVKNGVSNEDAVNLGQLNSAIDSVPTPDLSPYALKHTHPYVPTTDVALTATPSTVVKRDNSGDITARLFRSEYMTDVQDPTLFCIQAEAGALKNNYIRNVSKQTVADALAPLVGAPLAPWLYASKINGWTGNLYYKKFKDGTIIVTGALYNAVCSDNYTEKQIATLPVGYRPTTTLYGTAQTDALKWQVRIKIDKYGRIYSQTVGKYYSYITLVFKIG